MAAYEAAHFVVEADTVAIRAAPCEGAPEVGAYERGDVLEACSPSDAAWCEVSPGGLFAPTGALRRLDAATSAAVERTVASV